MNNRLKDLAKQMKLIGDELSRDDLSEQEILRLEERSNFIHEEISKNGYDFKLFTEYMNESKYKKVPEWFKGDI